ncbi:MAG: phosphoadenosine phosphosulfate reductase family protein, partial [Candidatus Omnitrophota bacterium]
FKSPILLWSSGKDSTVMLYLVRQVFKEIPIIFFREPFMQKKYSFANKVIQDLDLTVYDFPPLWTDFQYNTSMKTIDVYYGFDTGGGQLILAKGIKKTTQSPILCIYRDFLDRPVGGFDYKWDLTFIGHKNSDVDDVLGEVPLTSRMRGNGKTVLYYPLYEWTDKDIWGYIKTNKIPYNTKRYNDKDMAYNNDYYECCYNCLDPEQPEDVDCFLNGSIKNKSNGMDYALKYDNFREYLRKNGGINK